MATRLSHKCYVDRRTHLERDLRPTPPYGKRRKPSASRERNTYSVQTFVGERSLSLFRYHTGEGWRETEISKGAGEMRWK